MRGDRGTPRPCPRALRGELLLHGEAGVGKSTLLTVARRHGGAFRLLSVRGHEAESGLAYSGLADLLRPVLVGLAALPERQARALAGALALGPPAPADSFGTFAATLTLLSLVAEDGPLLVLIDDAHSLDAPSRDAILFAARRVATLPIALLLAVREGESDAFDATGLPTLPVRGLDRAASDALVSRSARNGPPAEVMQELFELSGGNPGALTELVGRLDRAPANPRAALDDATAGAAAAPQLIGRIEIWNGRTAERPGRPVTIGLPLIWLEDYGRARTSLERLADTGRALGSPSILAPALWNLTELDFRTGDWTSAAAAGTEAASLARREAGQLLHSCLVFLARVQAGRGLEEICRSHALEGIECSRRLGAGGGIAYGLGALGLLELGLGRPEQAIAHLEELGRELDGMEVREPSVSFSDPDLVEAYVRVGAIQEATAATRTLAARAEASGLVWPRASAARCAGLLAPDSEFESHFEHALALHGRLEQRFERARTELCFGERLRRAKRITDARPVLRSALETFEALGAAPWAARAQTELRATGERRRRGGETVSEELTPQELEIALLVARGVTNREASAALFLSPKTIEAHLSRIYRKRGVRSRTELAHQLAGSPLEAL